MKIYTRTGDKGETSLFSGQRLPKNHALIHAIGTVDECNCCIGQALSHLSTDADYLPLKEQLETIQHALFDVGAALATPRTTSSDRKIEKTRFDQEEIENLEQWIDEMEEELPTLKNFILPGGHSCGASLHLARGVCRRAERSLISINSDGDVSDRVMMYLNRLSDYLFVLSRKINQMEGSPETAWKPHLLKDH